MISGTASSVRYTSRIQGEFHDYLRRIRASNFGGFQTMHSQGWMNARLCVPADVWHVPLSGNLSAHVSNVGVRYSTHSPYWTGFCRYTPARNHSGSPDDCRATTQVGLPLTAQNV